MTDQVTPANYHEERVKFFSSDQYNPQFCYKRLPLSPIADQITSLENELAIIKLPAELEAHIHSLIRFLHAIHQAKQHIGHPDFPLYIQRVFPISSSTLDKLDVISKDIRFADTEKSTLFTAHQMRDYFQRYLNRHDHLKNIRVRVDTINDHTIRVGTKRLTIGADVKRLEANVKRLIIHEIESHILQRKNIKKQKNPLLRLRTHYNRELYSEGMAVYNEIASGTITRSAFEAYYYRAKAVHMMKHDFRTIFHALSPHLGEHKAFLTTYRIKRGMSDTGKSGGYPKDALYLLGYYEVKKYIERGGRVNFLYLTQDPELGELLLKYNLLPVSSYYEPQLGINY